jgi:hypothetical protein
MVLIAPHSLHHKQTLSFHADREWNIVHIIDMDDIPFLGGGSSPLLQGGTAREKGRTYRQAPEGRLEM